MIDIKENVDFKIEKVMILKGTMTQEELSAKMQGVMKTMQSLGEKPRDAFITGTGEKQPNGISYVEVMIPVTEPIEGLEGFEFFECFELNNAVNVTISGNFMEFQSEMPKMDSIIKEKGYVPTTVKYMVMEKPTSQNPMTAVLRADVYFGI